MARQPQRVHKTFYRLKLRANFFIGSKEYQKEGFCWYRRINVEAKTAEQWGKRTPIQFIAPWTVVRSDEFVNKKITIAQIAELNASYRARNERAKSVVASVLGERPPYTKEELEGTPYVGRTFSENHCEVAQGAPAPTIIPPNNDNNITGPTS